MKILLYYDNYVSLVGVMEVGVACHCKESVVPCVYYVKHFTVILKHGDSFLRVYFCAAL